MFIAYKQNKHENITSRHFYTNCFQKCIYPGSAGQGLSYIIADILLKESNILNALLLAAW